MTPTIALWISVGVLFFIIILVTIYLAWQIDVVQDELSEIREELHNRK